MAFTKSLDINNLELSIVMILYEWLTNADCFGSGDSRKADVINTIKLNVGELIYPQINTALIPMAVASTGAGQLNNKTEFRTYNFQIRIITDTNSKGYADELGAAQLGDILMKYYRNSTKGGYALAAAGLKKNRLFGVYPAYDDHYFYRDYFLRFRVML